MEKYSHIFEYFKTLKSITFKFIKEDTIDEECDGFQYMGFQQWGDTNLRAIREGMSKNTRLIGAMCITYKEKPALVLCINQTPVIVTRLRDTDLVTMIPILITELPFYVLQCRHEGGKILHIKEKGLYETLALFCGDE